MEEIIQKAKELEEAIKNKPQDQFKGGIILIHTDGENVQTTLKGEHFLMRNMVYISLKCCHQFHDVVRNSIL